MQSLENQFASAMEASGIAPPQNITADGTLHRFHINGDKPRTENGWYVLFGDDPAAGSFGCWKRNFAETWTAKNEHTLSEADRQKIWKRREEAKRQREVERARVQAEAAKKAQRIWESASEADTVAHAYTLKKGITPYGARLSKDALVVPVHRVDGRLVGLQFIKSDGSKKFLTGTEKTGSFAYLGEQPTSGLLICEGYATACSLHEATALPVVAAFDCGNLKAVAKTFRGAYPNLPITICADNDAFREEGNIGVDKATEAAHAVNATVIAPTFSDMSTRPTDFNDLHKLNGLEAVRQQVRVHSAPSALNFKIIDFGAERFHGEPPPVRWLVKNMFPLGVPLMVAGAGAVGKSFILLDLAVKVATASNSFFVNAFGSSVESFGSVVFLTAEDSKDALHRRLEVLDPDGRRHTYPGKLMVIPLPDAGGPFPLVSQKHGVMEETEQSKDLRSQLKRIHDLKLVIIDPLQTFVLADVNKDPAAAQFTCSLLAKMAAETGASIIVAHHMRKDSAKDSDKEDVTPEQARDRVRGTSALVDGVRGVFVLWPASTKKAKEACRSLDITFAPNRIIHGSIVKSNEAESRQVMTFYRDDSGVLIDATSSLKESTKMAAPEHLEILIEAIAAAAATGYPFTKTGQSGMYDRRHELPEPFNTTSKNDFGRIIDKLLQQNKIVQAKATASNHARWLDIPDGPFAKGEGKFQKGAPVPKTAVLTLVKREEE